MILRGGGPCQPRQRGVTHASRKLTSYRYQSITPSTTPLAVQAYIREQPKGSSANRVYNRVISTKAGCRPCISSGIENSGEKEEIQ
jgi:hypothetical protein